MIFPAINLLRCLTSTIDIFPGHRKNPKKNKKLSIQITIHAIIE